MLEEFEEVTEGRGGQQRCKRLRRGRGEDLEMEEKSDGIPAASRKRQRWELEDERGG